MKSIVFNVALLGLFAWGVLGAAPAHAVMYDLTTPGASQMVNGALFTQYNQQAAGTGNLDAFVRIHNTGEEEGFNTDGTPQMDTMGGLFTHSLRVSDAALVNINGVNYREFLLDINEISSGNKNFISLDALDVYVANQGDLTTLPGAQSMVFSLDAADQDHYIKLNYNINAGSGNADMAFYLRNDVFSDTDMYLYLYSMFGLNNATDDGFEEWAVSRNQEEPMLIPEPMTLALCGLGLGLAGLMRRTRKGAN